jgi:hypothetical protein
VVANVAKDASKRATPSARVEAPDRRSGDGARASTPATDPTAADTPAPRAASSRKPAGPDKAPVSIGTARAAPLHQWLARIWPAIELGGRDKEPALPILPALARVAGALRASHAAQLGVLGIGRASDSPVPAGNAIAPSNRFGADSGLVPSDRGFALFTTFYFAAVLALLASTIWTRLRARYR